MTDKQVNKTTEALKLSEEALNAMLTHMGMDEDEWTKPTFNQAREALAAIREALAEQEKQEPVAKVTDVFPTRVEWLREVAVNSLLYAAPVSAKREWVDLSNDEIDELIRKWHSPDMGLLDFARAVIVAFKEKNK